MFSAKNLLYGVMRFFHQEPPEDNAPQSPAETPEDMENAWNELSIPISKHYINPLAMTGADAATLGDLLQTCIEQKTFFLQKGLNVITREVNGRKERIYLHLENALLYRVCESNPDDYRFEIVGKEIGSGAFSKVYLSVGTLVPQADKSVQYKAPRDDQDRPVYAIRIIKDQVHAHPKFPAEKAMNESRLGKLTLHLGGKSPTLLNTKPVESFLVENLIMGEDLLTLLSNEREKERLSPAERQDLALEVLYALKEQIHARGILHRDIKPDNILVFRENGKFIVYIIDLGLSKLIAEPDEKEILGTIGYTAPEIYAKAGASEKCDVFGAGIVESLIWGARTPPIIEAVGKNKINVEKAQKSAETYVFPELFKDIQGFDHQKSAITAWLYKMIYRIPDERLSLDGAITELEDIILAARKLQLPPAQRDSFQCAHETAIKLRLQLAQATQPAARMLQQQIMSLGGEQWSPDAWEEFTRSLRERPLYGLQDKTAIINKINTIVAHYDAASTSLKAKAERVAELYSPCPADKDVKFLTDRILVSCRYITTKCAASRLNLEEMLTLTYKIQKRLVKADEHIAFLENRISQQMAANERHMQAI